MTTTRVTGALVLSALLLGGPSLALCQDSGMKGMSDMDMGHEVVIPKGADFYPGRRRIRTGDDRAPRAGDRHVPDGRVARRQSASAEALDQD